MDVCESCLGWKVILRIEYMYAIVFIGKACVLFVFPR